MKRYVIAAAVAAMLGAGATAFAKEVKEPETYAYTRGVEAYNEEKYADAMDWFRRELSEHPDNGYAYVYMTALYMGNNENGNALSSIEKALKRLPKKDKTWRALAFVNRGKVYLTMGDAVRALDDFGLAIKTDPSTLRYYNTRAQVYYEQQNYAAADEDYRKMISIDPGNVMGYMGLGRNFSDRKQWDDAIRQYDYVVKLAPDYSSGYSFRAEAYIGLEKWAEATDDLIRALDIDGDQTAGYHMASLPDEAAGLMKSKLKIQMTKQPSNNFWPFCIAKLEKGSGNYDEAISYYEKANKIDANSVLLEDIARCYKEKQDFESALDYAERALAMSPDDYDVVELKADILSDMGRFDECLVERDRYVAKYPEYPLAYLTRGDDRMMARRYEEAIEDYNAVEALAPYLNPFSYLYMKRGDAYRLTGKTAEARKEYERILAAEKDSVLTADSRTPFAYSYLGDAAKAIETMQTILATDTTDVAGTLYNAACVYARVGRNDEALRYLREAVDKGYKGRAHIAADYDFDGLREMPEYKEIMARLESAAPIEIKSQDELIGDGPTETVEVPFTKESGVTKVKCTINGLPLHFVFDTGAADVTMSMVEANFMLKNDYIKPTDVIGSERYIDANGDISEGTVVNLRKVDFGGLELENVRASVVRNQKAPLLLGQSVLGRLGKIEIDNSAQKLVITHRK